jgi:hypothetical protein
MEIKDIKITKISAVRQIPQKSGPSKKVNLKVYFEEEDLVISATITDWFNTFGSQWQEFKEEMKPLLQYGYYVILGDDEYKMLSDALMKLKYDSTSCNSDGSGATENEQLLLQ